MPLDTLYDIASDLIATTANALAVAGLDAPDRRYVETCNVTAPLAFDDKCTNQLTVHVGSLLPSTTVTARQGSAPRGGCGMAWAATFTITHIRCYPIQNALLTAAKYDALGREHLRYGWQVARHLAWQWSKGVLTPSYPLDCSGIRWGTLTCVAPRGGLMGWALPLTFDPIADPYDGSGA